MAIGPDHLRRPASCYDPGMCGRYASFLPAEALSRIFGTRDPLPNIAPSWNLASTQSAPVVRRHPDTGERHRDLARWDFQAHWTLPENTAPRPINAWAATVATSGKFRAAFARRRCIVPADARLARQQQT